MHQEAYDKAEGLRRSDLWTIHKSPHHFKTQMDGVRKESAAFSFGIAVHKYILEPSTFFDEYAVAPNVDRRRKEGKEIWEKFTQECEQNDKEPIAESTFAQIKEMAAAVNANPLAKQILTGQAETEWYWTDTLTGEKLKCKCDMITDYNRKKYIVDYKTTDSCEDGHFERSARKYGYQFQAGFYATGVETNTGETYGFIFVAQEKKAPYACRVYICSDTFVERGKAIYRELLDLYHECKTTNDWYGYEGTAANPTPTMLMDDSERVSMAFASKYGNNMPLYQSGFKSDDYSDYDEPEEEEGPDTE